MKTLFAIAAGSFVAVLFVLCKLLTDPALAGLALSVVQWFWRPRSRRLHVMNETAETLFPGLERLVTEVDERIRLSI